MTEEEFDKAFIDYCKQIAADPECVYPSDMVLEEAWANADGTLYYKVNLGTTQHPLWIFGSTEKLHERIIQFKAAMCRQVKISIDEWKENNKDE